MHVYWGEFHCVTEDYGDQTVWQHTVHRLRIPAVHSSRNLEGHIVISAHCTLDVSGAISVDKVLDLL